MAIKKILLSDPYMYLDLRYLLYQTTITFYKQNYMIFL